MSTWILRAKKLPIDNWRYDAHLLAPGNDPLLLRKIDVCKETHPILYDIVCAYNRFYFEFCKHKHNFLHSIIFDNPLFRDPENNNTLDAAFFGNNYYNDKKVLIRRLSVSDCFLNKCFRNPAQFENIGLPLTMVRWLRLRNAIMRVYTVNQVEWDHPNLTGIHRFSEQWKKGSKKVRKYLDTVTDPLVSRSFNKFVELVDCNPNFKFNQGALWFSNWNIHSLNNDFRNFIFNCRYNYLPTNNRLNAYIADVDPRCTYCRVLNAGSDQRDSFAHALFECNTVKQLLNNICTRLNFGTTTSNNNFRKLFWYGVSENHEPSKELQMGFLIFFDSFRYLIFKHRRRHHIPNDDDILEEIKFFIHNLCKANKKINAVFSGHNPLRSLLQARG
jgi:hypothetical protein